MLEKTKEWGLRNSRGNQGQLCQSHVYSIITNPFYYGVMRVLKTKKRILTYLPAYSYQGGI